MSRRFVVREPTVLGDDAEEAPWVGRLIGLGARLAHLDILPGHQLVVVLSVPTREFVAATLACGWLLRRGFLGPKSFESIAKNLRPQMPVRFLAGGTVRSERFKSIDVGSGRVNIGGSNWHRSSIQQITIDESLNEQNFAVERIPSPGDIVSMANLDSEWRSRHCESGAFVTVVGHKARNLDNHGIEIGLDGLQPAFNRLADLIRPKTPKSQIWWSEFLSGSGSDAPEVADSAELTILDGYPGVRWLNTIMCRRVVCVIDRSVDSPSGLDAVSLIMQARARSRLVDLDQFRMAPIVGVEVLAFQVRSE